MADGTDITMPQLGETVTEGTITRWFKQPGERIDVDEPLFEVSTDKVDSEVPSPIAGVVQEILVPEGETAQVGDRLAVVGEGAGGAPAAAEPEPTTEPEPQPVPEPPAAREPAPPPPAPSPAAPAVPSGDGRKGGMVTSPVVRRLIDERGLDPADIPGTGEGGRITRRDVESFVGTRTAPVAATGRPSEAAPPRARRGDETVPFDNIRRRTAEHMVRSLQTSAHVYTSVEVDFERVDQVRREHRSEWAEREGFSLTYLPFVARAFCDAVDDWPRVNASVEGESLIVHHDVNLAIAVDMDHQGLVAPVIREADGKRLRVLAREIRDLADRARNRQLAPDDVVGGTFTITNAGPFGSFMTLPIINQPQVAILSTDGIKKRPVVVEGPDGEDAIAAHPTGMLALTWDHRAFDGAYAASFLHRMAEILETRDWDAELV